MVRAGGWRRTAVTARRRDAAHLGTAAARGVRPRRAAPPTDEPAGPDPRGLPEPGDSDPATTPVRRHGLAATPLGANTGGEWSGVSGRISAHGSILPPPYDFVAGGSWSSGTWAAGTSPGWRRLGGNRLGRRRPSTSTRSTPTPRPGSSRPVRAAGDKVWLDLHSDSDGVWGAWLWWNNRWNLLTAQKLPIGTAYVEQYVEVHVDASRPTRVDVPAVHRGQRAATARGARCRRSGSNRPAAAQRRASCLTWLTRTTRGPRATARTTRAASAAACWTLAAPPTRSRPATPHWSATVDRPAVARPARPVPVRPVPALPIRPGQSPHRRSRSTSPPTRPGRTEPAGRMTSITTDAGPAGGATGRRCSVRVGHTGPSPPAGPARGRRRTLAARRPVRAV